MERLRAGVENACLQLQDNDSRRGEKAKATSDGGPEVVSHQAELGFRLCSVLALRYRLQFHMLVL